MSETVLPPLFAAAVQDALERVTAAMVSGREAAERACVAMIQLRAMHDELDAAERAARDNASPLLARSRKRRRGR